MVLPFTFFQEGEGYPFAKDAKSGGSGPGWELNQQALGWCWSLIFPELTSVLVFRHSVTYIRMSLSCLPDTHTHNQQPLFSQLLLSFPPSALDSVWSNGCFHTPCIHHGLFPSLIMFSRVIPLGLLPFHFVFYFFCFFLGCSKHLPTDFQQECGGALWRCRCEAMAMFSAFSPALFTIGTSCRLCSTAHSL